MESVIKNKNALSMGADLIWNERQEHFHKHNRSIDDDIKNNINAELVYAAAVLLLAPYVGDDFIHDFYPYKWDKKFLEHVLQNKNRTEQLSVAGALVAAEIDRIQFYKEYYDELHPAQENNVPQNAQINNIPVNQTEQEQAHSLWQDQEASRWSNAPPAYVQWSTGNDPI
jgi:hypothetical protein